MQDYIRLAAQRVSDHVSSLKAYHDRSVNRSAREGQPENLKSLDKWEEAMSAAVTASQNFRDAETKRQIQLTDKANSIAEKAVAYLKRSVDAIPILDKHELIMSGWDEEEVEKA